MSKSSRPLHELPEFKRDVLAAVAKLDDPNGREIQSHVTESYGTLIRENRVYRNLRELEDVGLVEVDRDGLTNSYRLTEDGEAKARADVKWREFR